MPPRFSLEYYDPPPQLERHVLVLFHFTSDLPELKDRHPGALGQLTLFMRGEGEMIFVDKTDKAQGAAHLMTFYSAAARFEVRGPWHVIGASLSPLGWAALTGVPASDHVDRLLPAVDLLGDEVERFARGLAERYCDGQLSGKAACDALGEWIAPRLGPVPTLHEKLIEQTIGWLGSSLNPDLDALYARLAYSRRQAERLVERYFGFPPAALARKYRAVRAASLLAQEALGAREEAAIGEAFYDQSHMVREIRRYCGHTPSRLGGDGEPIMKTLLQMKNFDRLQQFRAIQ